MTNAASDVESELPGAGSGGDGGKTDSLEGKSAHYERRVKIVKCGCLVAATGVFAALISWASGAFSKSASDVRVQSSAASYIPQVEEERSARHEANGYKTRSAKSAKGTKVGVIFDFRSRPFADFVSVSTSSTFKALIASDIGEDPTSNMIPWTSFFTATIPGGPLENCVLAPVTSESDLNEIGAAAGNEDWTWVGVMKSAQDVVNDNGGNGSPNNWYNLDGTSVPNTGVWAPDKPDNGQSLQTYAFFTSKRFALDDLENYRPDLSQNFRINKAVMKCCAKGYIPQTFCTAV
ncbi:hypothetical protein THAOC_24621 [Thalassiosira oceanica]|uniref:C-type lectin domain-containing protein n=1 Tax=Thalassiosira oceanica TaxID=159749 RepID=K0RTE6_THAOC|nr:hypothetical protein THAOC_24621 [Thalassiosira oceanica]|eukprot:EJK55629.1 hypothetical protein THAOC_24621 [Thalassiosira oceanica]